MKTAIALLVVGSFAACVGQGMSVADCQAQCKPRQMCSFSDDRDGHGLCVCEDQNGECPPAGDNAGEP
jgi:hypothetical protein